MSDMDDCESCGIEGAYNVQMEDGFIIFGDHREPRPLCEFCRSIPGGTMRNGDGRAYAVVGNLIVKALRAQP